MATQTKSCRRPRTSPLDPSAPRPTDILLAFLVPGIALLLAAAIAAVVGAATGWTPARWLALHLALLGGVSQMVLGVSQFFVTAFLATTPPSRRMVAAQLTCWNTGTLAVAVGVAATVEPLVVAGSIALMATLALYALALRTLRRQSLQRAPWATRWYGTCAAFLALGIVLGALLATGVSWRHGSLLGAHLALNLGGWLGGAIVGTLHTFFPSLTQTKLRFPQLQPAAFAGWTVGVGALAAGYGLDSGGLVAAGWASLSAGAAALAVNLVASALAAPAPLSLPTRLIGLGQCFLVAGLALAVATVLSDDALAPLAGAPRSALAVLLLAGWVGLTVIGSLLHLLAVVLRVRDLSRPLPVPNRMRDAALPLLAAAGIGGLAVARLASIDVLVAPAALMAAAAYLLLAARVARFAGAALRVGLRARPR